MKTQLLKTFTIIAFFAMTTMSAQLTTFSTADLDGWATSWGSHGTVSHDASEGVSADGALKLERITDNANFGIKVGGAITETGIDASAKKGIRLRFKNETKGVQLLIGGKNGSNTTIKNDSGGNITFSIGASSSEYVTMYLDMSDIALWSGDLTNFYLQVKNNQADDLVTDAFYLDEIEFIDALPEPAFSEFIKNPGFDDVSNDISHLSGSKTFVSRTLSTTEAHDGTQSIAHTFTSDADAHFWTFSSYVKTYGSVYPIGHAIQIKMWVKTNRAAPVSVAARVKLTLSGDEVEKPIVNVTTTNTAMGWEELTFDITNTAAFDGVTFWYALNYVDGEPTNLLNGDIVYIDQMSATISEEVVASVGKNTLEDVAVYPNPVADNLHIEAPVGSAISITNLAGVVVKSISNSFKSNTIDISNLAPGIYIAKVTNGLKFFIEKLVVK